MSGMGKTADWGEKAHHRLGETGAGARRIVRSENTADSERAFSCDRAHGQPELVLSHTGSLRNASSRLIGGGLISIGRLYLGRELLHDACQQRWELRIVGRLLKNLRV